MKYLLIQIIDLTILSHLEIYALKFVMKITVHSVIDAPSAIDALKTA